MIKLYSLFLELLVTHRYRYRYIHCIVIGAVTCIDCTPGRYQGVDGATSCIDCVAGRYSVGYGSTNCTVCVAGKFSLLPAQNDCQPCAQGTASAVPGLNVSCPLCPAGKFSRNQASTDCTVCSGSEYTSNAGSIEPLICEGRIGGGDGIGGIGVGGVGARSSCSPYGCDLNAELLVDHSCRNCSLGSHSGGVTCVPCSANSYTPAPGVDCIPCNFNGEMAGLNCAGGLAAVYAGYWVYTVMTPMVINNQPVLIPLLQTAKCASGYCPGVSAEVLNSLVFNVTVTTSIGSSNGNGSVSSGSSVVSSYSSLSLNTSMYSLLVANQCQWPRVASADNVLCASCVGGYIDWHGDCKPCVDTNAGLIFAALVISLLLLLFLYYSSSSSPGYISIIYL
jgi:hypothetical protein